MLPYTFTQQLSEAEYRGALRQLHRWLKRVILPLPAVVLGLQSWYLGEPIMLFGAAWMALVAGLLYRFPVPSLSWRYHINPLLHQSATYTLSERGLDIVGDKQSWAVRWGQFRALHETRDFLFADILPIGKMVLRKDRLTPQAIEYLRAHSQGFFGQSERTYDS